RAGGAVRLQRGRSGLRGDRADRGRRGGHAGAGVGAAEASARHRPGGAGRPAGPARPTALVLREGDRMTPEPLRGPDFGSYPAEDVAWLLKDLSQVKMEAPIEE